MVGLDADLSPRRLERYLALVLGSDVSPVVVLSKADVCAHALDDRLQTLPRACSPAWRWCRSTRATRTPSRN